MRRLIVLMTALVAFAATAVPAFAAGFDPAQIEFPLDGTHRTTDSFGDCRGSGCSRSHEGVDIMAAKGIPVLAAADGVVDWIPTNCCALGVDHGDGWQTRYIHLNNDTQNPDGSYSNDGLGWGIADGIVHGSTVTKGQVIGWVGNSGNAEGGASHLHFELRRNGVAMDPYPYLTAAEGNWVGQFSDDDGSVHQANIDMIYLQRITLGCNPPLNTMFCPQRNITRGEMAAFLARALSLPQGTGVPAYDDIDGHLFEVAVDKIQAAGIGFGCDANSFCPDRPLLRDEMAEMLVRAFTYENPDATDFFGDDNGNPYEASINKLASAGITVGCNPPNNTNFCPARQLSRGEMATFFVRALEL